MINNDDMYHTCRWCRYYIKGCCTLRMFSPVLTDNVYTVAEDGGLSAVIEETLNSNKPKELMKLLDNLLTSYRLSKARREEVRELIEDGLLQYNDFILKEQLDAAVSRLYQDRLDNAAVTEELMIKDPESFYCKYWS